MTLGRASSIFFSVLLTSSTGARAVPADDRFVVIRPETTPHAAALFAAAGPASPAFYQTVSFYAVAISIMLAAGYGGYRWMVRWRRRLQQQRDQEVFKLIDEWTKSLQQEVLERKQAQKALVESQEIVMRQERLAAVGQMAAGVAHEFNNILTVIQGHAALLLENPSLDDESVKSLTHITSGVERTAKLIRQMLAFSRKQVMQR